MIVAVAIVTLACWVESSALRLGHGVARPVSSRLFASSNMNDGIDVAAEWVSNLEVSNYGVFERAEMKLSGGPSFVVITGETGAGKSVLVSALEYALSGSNKRNLLLKSPGGADVKDERVKESFVSLCLADHEQKELLGIKRSLSLSGKRSTCQVNGEKITNKALSEQIGGIVKFWTAETSCLVDTGSKSPSSGAEGNTFLAHVNNNLDEEGLDVLQKLPEAYSEWRKAYIERSRLERLQDSANEGNDASLLEFYIEEVDGLEESVAEVFADLLKVLEEYEEVALDGAAPSPSLLGGDAGGGEGASGVGSTRALIELVSRVLDGPGTEGSDEHRDEGDGDRGYNYAGSVPRVDLQGAWKVLRRAEDWASTLQAAMEHSFPDSALDGGSGGGGGSGADEFMAGLGLGSGSSRARRAGAAANMRDVEDAIEDYVDRLITLQEALREVGLGVVDAGIDSRIEETHVALQASLRSIKTATGMLGGLREAMPDLSSTVGAVTALRLQWETIRRKHGPGERGTRSGADLASLKRLWVRDVASLASLESALPLAISREERASQAYATLAQRLSSARARAAEALLGRVNSLLPSLEMSGVEVTAAVHSAGEGQGEGQGEARQSTLTPLQQSVRADGWDAVTLHASHSPAGAFASGGGAGAAATSTARSASTLSSGENARLALAIESCAVSSSSSRSSFGYFAAARGGVGGLETMIVYDEIDAHVGGEAAVAVARLLRQQGSRRQVVAITHNPVIAAAADQHFVVSRLAGSGDTDIDAGQGMEPGPVSRRGSQVVEVEGVDRENELTRMTTGNLDTSAGLELARALLEEFQQS